MFIYKLKIVCFFLGLTILACSTKKEYKIKGTIKGYPEGIVYLNIVREGSLVPVDSAIITNEEFLFKGAVETPEMYLLTNKSTTDELYIFLDNSEILIETIIENFEEGTISGSLTHDELTRFIDKEQVFEEQLDSIYDQYMDAQDIYNEELMKELEEYYDQIHNKKIRYTKEYVFNNNKSFVSPYLLYRKLIYYIDLKELDSLTNNFVVSLEQSPYVKLLRDRIEVLKRVDIGQPFAEIELKDTSGVPIALSSLKGKYILIDFWASWCPPCRVENPNIVELYEKYKDKGFEIYAVSLDSNREKWIRGIKEDEITYTQVSDLRGWKSSAAKLYGVQSIPHTILINEEGIIIAKNLSSEELQKRLEKLD